MPGKSRAFYYAQGNVLAVSYYYYYYTRNIRSLRILDNTRTRINWKSENAAPKRIVRPTKRLSRIYIYIYITTKTVFKRFFVEIGDFSGPRRLIYSSSYTYCTYWIIQYVGSIPLPWDRIWIMLMRGWWRSNGLRNWRY